MTDLPIYPVLKLLTDEEIERALARTYTLQEGTGQHVYLRSDRLATPESFNGMGVCFLGEALDLEYSPSAFEVAESLAYRSPVDIDDRACSLRWASSPATSR
jgi:hypothetical protein